MTPITLAAVSVLLLVADLAELCCSRRERESIRWSHFVTSKAMSYCEAYQKDSAIVVRKERVGKGVDER